MGEKSKRRPMAQINVVPYIDVMLVLLVIFMITAPMIQMGIEVNLPQVDAKPLGQTAEEKEPPIVLTVDAKGQFSIDGQPMNPELIERYIQDKIVSFPAVKAYVRGDRDVVYGRVMDAMVLLQENGIARVGLITEPPERSR